MKKIHHHVQRPERLTRRKNQFIVDLPRCKMNSGVQILGKIEVSVKSQTKTHFQQTNISSDLSRKIEVRRSGKCSFISISVPLLIYLKLQLQISPIFSVK